MKKLFLLTLMLLSVSSFAQYKTEQSNSESENTWIVLDDEKSQWYDTAQIYATYSHNPRVYPEKSEFVKKDTFTTWVICIMAVMITLYVIISITVLRNAANIYEKIEIMSRKNKDLKAQLFNLKVDLNEMIVPKPLYERGETYGKYKIVDFGHIYNKSYLITGYRYDVRSTDTGKVYHDILEEVLTLMIENEANKK